MQGARRASSVFAQAQTTDPAALPCYCEGAYYSIFHTRGAIVSHARIVPWFSRENYDAVKRLAPHDADLSDTFDEWLKLTTQRHQESAGPASLRATLIEPR